MIRISVAGFELSARLEEDSSPRTVAFVRTMLPYEMARAMFDRANQLKPSLVMNDRNGESYSGDRYFDYHGTPDKPRYFQPVEGYWEAIPTTNESYGYNKSDKSHKSPAELIELLARGLCGVDPTRSRNIGQNGPLILALQISAFAPAEQFLGDRIFEVTLDLRMLFRLEGV